MAGCSWGSGIRAWAVMPSSWKSHPTTSSGKPQPQYTLHKLRLGEGLGIREIVATRAGFLIIAGNAGSEPSKKFAESEGYEKGRGYSLVFWDGKGPEVGRIGSIPNPPGKAEAMTVLEETPSDITVLILFDGPKGVARRPIAFGRRWLVLLSMQPCDQLFRGFLCQTCLPPQEVVSLDELLELLLCDPLDVRIKEQDITPAPVIPLAVDRNQVRVRVGVSQICSAIDIWDTPLCPRDHTHSSGCGRGLPPWS